MKILKFKLALNFFLISIISNAQLSIVYDKDGFVNLREKPSIKAKVISKVEESQIFSISPYYDESLINSDWIKVWVPIHSDSKIKDFIKYKDINEDGYIHKSRIISLEQLKEIKIINENSKKVSFKSNNFQIHIEIKDFDKTQHHISKSKDEITIDHNSHIWGFQNQIPKIELKSIKISNDGEIYTFPKEAIFGFYDLNLELTKLFFGQKNELYLVMSGADGSESYEVIWCLKNKKIYSMAVMAIMP